MARAGKGTLRIWRVVYEWEVNARDVCTYIALPPPHGEEPSLPPTPHTLAALYSFS